MSLILYHDQVETPLGPMAAFATPAGLGVLEFLRTDRFDDLLARWRRQPEPLEIRSQLNPILQLTRRWLDDYFTGRLAGLPEISLDLRGTPFELTVWRALLRVGPGATSTYGSLAAEAGRPNGARAVGGAVGRNPVAVIVPCHRIIGASGALTGYGGGLDRKRWLLAHERAHSG